MTAESLVLGPRNSQTENENCRALRELPEDVRVKIIQEVLDKNRALGLRLAMRTIRSKKFFVEILNRGLDAADASEIYYWLECVSPRIGPKRILRILGERLADNPEAVAKATYWMPRFIAQDNSQQVEILQSLNQSLEALGAQRVPRIAEDPERPGVFLFGDIDGGPDEYD